MNNLSEPGGSGEAGVFLQDNTKRICINTLYFLHEYSVELSAGIHYSSGLFSVWQHRNVPPLADGYFVFCLSVDFMELKKSRVYVTHDKQEFYRAQILLSYLSSLPLVFSMSTLSYGG